MGEILFGAIEILSGNLEEHFTRNSKNGKPFNLKNVQITSKSSENREEGPSAHIFNVMLETEDD